jgi:EAL domain-containing protein (putative c-di-GMP-specific phosphodiesterase class I)
LSLDPHRLLGFAFAAADLLIEVEPTGRISLAVGAGDLLTGGDEQALMGHAWRHFVDPRDAPLIEALFEGLDGAGRKGPVVARQKTPSATRARAFALSACRLPQNGDRISCALARASDAGLPSRPDGLHDKAAFEALAQTLMAEARAEGRDLEMAFVDMAGLAAAKTKLAPDKAQALQQKLGGALRAESHGGAAAAVLSEERYALVRQSGRSADELSARIAGLIAREAGGVDVRPATQALALASEAGQAQVMRAMRLALDDFIKDGVDASAPASITEAVERQVRQTLARADALSATVSQRRFSLVFQPVVSLKSGETHHHEVLVRFGDNASPFPMIRMAEELDMIEDLDLAIAEQAIAVMQKQTKVSLAVNLSGRTIVTDSFLSRITRMIDAAPAVKGRLMFEITESAAIEDLALADRHIQALRSRGCQVCLDDFGAGAASLAYLQQLSLDVVKIDGRYVTGLRHGGRESAFIKHLVVMCAELKVATLAEMIETREAEDAVRRAGVDYGQGWLYGAAADTPQPASAAPASHNPVRPAARRMGAVETWG